MVPAVLLSAHVSTPLAVACGVVPVVFAVGFAPSIQVEAAVVVFLASTDWHVQNKHFEMEDDVK